MTLTHILVPIDFSSDASLAARHAAAIARRFGAKLSLFHVDVLPAFSERMAEHVAPDVWEGYLESRVRAVKERLDEIAWPVEAGDRNVASAASEENVPERIARVAANQHVDLIVMAPYGSHGSSRFLLGSVTGGVAAIATCPVLVLRDRGEHYPPRDGAFHRALLTLSGCESHDRATQLALVLTARDAHVDVFHAVEREAPSALLMPSAVAEMFAENRARARAEIERAAERLRLEGRRVSIIVEKGDPPSALLDRLGGLDHDLVVAGARSVRRRADAIGAVTQRLLQHSPVPVAVFPVD